MLSNQASQQLILFAGAARARTSAWQEIAQDWLENKADYSLNLFASLKKLSRLGLSLRMSKIYYGQMTEEILQSSSFNWSNAGIASGGGYLMLNISESPNGESACSLSGILETEAPQKYYLSPKACRGILIRANRRKKPLPPLLEAVIQAQAAALSEME